jgi:single-stranded DNA-binding protein
LTWQIGVGVKAPWHGPDAHPVVQRDATASTMSGVTGGSRAAVSARMDQQPSFFIVIVWRDQAEHAAESLSKGSRVVVVGRLQQRSWDR